MTDKLRSRLLTAAERMAALDRRWDETGEPMNEDEQTEYLEDASDLASLVLEVLGEAPTIYDLTTRVREHPDFAFGVVFTREDFPNGVIPDDFSGRVIEDLLAQRGNEYIADNYGSVED